MDRSAIRDVHRQIKARIKRALGRRSWTWLAKQSGIPQSTLSSQASREKFTVATLARVAETLGVTIAELVPGSPRGGLEREAFEQLLDQLEEVVRVNRVRITQDDPPSESG